MAENFILILTKFLKNVTSSFQKLVFPCCFYISFSGLELKENFILGKRIKSSSQYQFIHYPENLERIPI